MSRVNRVISTFVKCFGMSQDVVYYKEGRPVAFKIFDRNGKTLILVAEETKNGNVICTAIVK